MVRDGVRAPIGDGTVVRMAVMVYASSACQEIADVPVI
jgi:hypothetical protein